MAQLCSQTEITKSEKVKGSDARFLQVMSQLLQDLTTWFNSLLARIAGLLSVTSSAT